MDQNWCSPSAEYAPRAELDLDDKSGDYFISMEKSLEKIVSISKSIKFRLNVDVI